MKDLKTIIKEEINDFDWVKDVLLDKTLDDMFGLFYDNNNRIYMRHASNVGEGVAVYESIVRATGEGIYRKLNKRDFKWYKIMDVVNMFRAGNMIDKWRSSRLRDIEKDYPKVHKLYKSRLTGG